MGPTKNPKDLTDFVKEELERDSPYGAKVTVSDLQAYRGWNAEGKFSKRFNKILNESSESFYGKKAQYIGEGGSIPLVNHLQDLYPKSQILVTGILGPGHNAHGPNENLVIDYTKKFVCVLAKIITDQCKVDIFSDSNSNSSDNEKTEDTL